MIQTIEELSFNAWPSLQTILFDGWVIRFANGFTKRANSINPVYGSTFDVEKKIDYCEELFLHKNLPVVFKITPKVYPDDLDHILEKRGYQIESRTSLQMLDMVDYSIVKNVELNETSTEEWISGFCTANNIAEENKNTIRQMLQNIVPQKCFSMIRRNEQGIAFGMGVLQNEYIGFYDIVTNASFRNQGIGKQLMFALLGWGKQNHAKQAYLQVMLNNAPALHLYTQLGFHEVYQYWYRIKK
jgi:N-acetylglutamate synthase